MTHSKQTVQHIVEMWGLGFTAEETRRALREQYSVHVGLATVYRKRHSITAQIMIDELMRKQMRDIARSDTAESRMKYRDKLLEKLIPQRIESVTEATLKHVEEKRDVTIIAEYTRAIDSAVDRDIKALRARKQVDTPRANTKTD